MPILVTAQVENQTEQLDDGMLSALAPLLKRAEGFIMHSAHRTPTGEWRVLEVRETKAHADKFFARTVAPNLPPGVRPSAASSSCTASSRRGPERCCRTA